MKKAIITFLFFLCSIMTFAQSESAKPTFGVELDREVAIAIIEKETYKDVVVELKSADLGDLFVDGVKITVKDAKTGKRIYKKRSAVNEKSISAKRKIVRLRLKNRLAQIFQQVSTH